MAQETAAIETPELPLQACSVADHCLALRTIKRLPFWWYLGRHAVLGNFSVPFRDARDHWWYQVKPGLCWAADCFAPLDPRTARPALTKSFLGYQHVVGGEAQANSHLVINAILDLAAYGPAAINTKRRNSVRKGFRGVTLEVLRGYDSDTFDQCRQAWDELTRRTGWKQTAEKGDFDETWKLLISCPGVSILVGREQASKQVAGFLVTKIIGDTAYVDTIASRTEMLHTNVNDAILYAFLMNAKRLPGVTKAHYAIRSYVEQLEKFKTGLGFVPVPFPARTRLRGLTGLVLRKFFPDKYKRMFGLFDEPEAAKTAPETPAAEQQAPKQQ